MCNNITDDVSNTHHNEKLGVDETRDDEERGSAKKIIH